MPVQTGHADLPCSRAPAAELSALPMLPQFRVRTIAVLLDSLRNFMSWSRGIGTALVSAVLKRAREADIVAIDLEIKIAHNHCVRHSAFGL